MKKLIVAFIALSSIGAQAQPVKAWGNSVADSVSCWENLNIAGSYYQNKTYAQAYDAWYQLYTTCPGASKNTYIIAPKVIESKIKETESAEEKVALAKILIEQYDKRLEYFPEKEGYIKSEKAADYLKYNKEDFETAYNLFTEAFGVAGKDMYPSQLNSYFISTVRMFNADKIDLDEMLGIYSTITDALDYNVIKYSKQIADLEALQEAGECDAKCEKNINKYGRINDGYDKVQSNIEKMLAPVLSCDKLILVYTEEKFEENKTNTKWLNSALKMLEKERVDDEGNATDCTDNPMYFDIAEALYNIEPSAQAARSMAKLAYRKKDYPTANKYYDQAINLEDDPRKKANDYLKSAVILQRRGSLSQAKTYALNAAKFRKNWGDPYIVLASVYADAAGTCGSDAVEKNAVYWVAIDKLNYAKSIDPDVSSKANKLIAAYKKAVPDKSVAFQLNKKEGDKVNIGCWINETAVVKFY